MTTVDASGIITWVLVLPLVLPLLAYFGLALWGRIRRRRSPPHVPKGPPPGPDGWDEARAAIRRAQRAARGHDGVLSALHHAQQALSPGTAIDRNAARGHLERAISAAQTVGAWQSCADPAPCLLFPCLTPLARALLAALAAVVGLAIAGLALQHQDRRAAAAKFRKLAQEPVYSPPAPTVPVHRCHDTRCRKTAQHGCHDLDCNELTPAARTQGHLANELERLRRIAEQLP